MRTRTDPAEVVAGLLNDQERTYAWLSRATGIPYPRVLASTKNKRRPLALVDAALIADALGVDLPVLIGESEAAA